MHASESILPLFLLTLPLLTLPLQAQTVGSAGAGSGFGRAAGLPAIGAGGFVGGPRGSGGLDPLSPEVPGIDPADLGRFEPGCVPVFAWPRPDLGVPPGGNIDAASDFRDVTPSYGPASAFWPPPGREVVLSFSVDRASTGVLWVASEAASDGAASDVFSVVLTPAPRPAAVFVDGECLSTLPGPQSDIDSILRSKVVRYPIFYSVDPPTAAAMGVSPADILAVIAPGAAPVLAAPFFELGLVPGDDIDALAMGGEGIVFSLTRGSPTALANPAVGSAGLFTVGALPWAYWWQLSLLPGDELNALAIGDPEIRHVGQPLKQGGEALVCSDPQTGAALETSLWQLHDLSQLDVPFHVSQVHVGVQEVFGADFDVRVRLWGAPNSDPLAPKQLLGESALVYPAGVTWGTVFSHPFDDLLVPDPFLWIELLLPPAPPLFDTAFVAPLIAPGELQPSFVSSPLCQPQLIDLDLVGLPQAPVITLDGFCDPDFQLVTGQALDNQPLWVFVCDAPPNGQVEFFFGLGGPGAGPCLPNYFGECLGLLPPIQQGPILPLDPLGATQGFLPVPPGMSGLDLMTQGLTLDPQQPGLGLSSNAVRLEVK